MPFGEVHWHEGLFLRPHHLQAQQRGYTERFASERALAWAYPYGLVESRISPDAMENMSVQFDRLRAVMPSGIEVRYPESAELPALNIKEAFLSGRGSLTVFLGVPLWYSSRGNALEAGAPDWREKKIYRVVEKEFADENTGENAVPLLVRKINARLLLEDQDPTDLELLPVLKIVRAAGEASSLPRQDPQFIPPCMVTGGSVVLSELVRDLASQVEASRQELVIQLTRGGFQAANMKGMQFEQQLRLRTLNRFAARLPALAAVPAVPPFALYLELRDLLAELAALQPDRDPFEVSKYDHDRPALAFQELSSRIRSLLRGTVAPSFIQAPFVPEGGLLVVHLTDEHLTRPNEYFLGIRTKEDHKVVARLVENLDEFKLMAKSLGHRAIFGVRLSLERVPPLELPAEPGLLYFRFMRGESARMWERVRDERCISAKWPSMDTSDYKLSLYMTVPNQPEAQA